MTDTVKVLIGDKMDPKAATIFRERGIEVDEKPGLSADELKAIIGEYDGLAVRSSTKVNAAAMDAAGEEPNPLARREMTEELRRLLACLGQLDEQRRRMVLLAYYSGWSRDQLAVQFDAPANTIKTWLRRSLLEIRECLGS